MARCDLCDARVNAGDLRQLLGSYQMDGVVDVCPSCAKWADKTKARMFAEASQRVRDAIKARRVQADMPSRDGWLNWIVHAFIGAHFTKSDTQVTQTGGQDV